MSPATALSQARDWLRRVTFGELKAIFPVKNGPNGAYLALHETSRFTGAGGGVPLVLGPDEACPFAQPHEWAAFTVTGA